MGHGRMTANWHARLPQLQHLQQLQHLPRDTRDTLFQLLVIAWTITPHLLHLPLWCGAMSAALLVWRARLALQAAALPHRWIISVLLIAASVLTFWGEKTLLGKEAGITLLVVLMSLKTLELRARRDALVVFFLGFFLVLTHFLYSQSLLTGLWLLLAVWGLLTAQVLAHMPVGRPSLRRAAGRCGGRASGPSTWARRCSARWPCRCGWRCCWAPCRSACQWRRCSGMHTRCCSALRRR